MGWPSAFSMLLTVALLFCAAYSMNFCCLIFYIFYTLVDFFNNLDPIGLLIQNSILGQANSFTLTPLMFVLVSFMIFELVAVYLAFLAYREFKAGLYSGGMGGSGNMMSAMGVGQGTTGSSQ